MEKGLKLEIVDCRTEFHFSSIRVNTEEKPPKENITTVPLSKVLRTP